jgi:hypothetical protein
MLSPIAREALHDRCASGSRRESRAGANDGFGSGYAFRTPTAIRDPSKSGYPGHMMGGKPSFMFRVQMEVM